MESIMQIWNIIQSYISDHIWLAPLFAVILPFCEAVIPFLSLITFISFIQALLTSLFGGILGNLMTIILCSLGSLLGMILIFFIIRKTLSPYFERKVKEHKYGKKFLHIVEGPNTFLVLILLANPFLPSSILNYTLALTEIKFKRYLWLTAAARIVIISMFVLIGELLAIKDHPLNMLYVILIYTGLFAIYGIWRKLYDRKKNQNPTKED